MDITAVFSQAAFMVLASRALPLLLAACLLPCGSALAAAPPKPKPKPTPAKGHVGIGNAWGPVVVHPSHPGSH
jgi:hypothetical protein